MPLNRYIPAGLLVAALSLIVVLTSIFAVKPIATEAAGAALHFPETKCATSGATATTADVSFSWVPTGAASDAWLDVGTPDSGFAPGSFIGARVTGEDTYDWKSLKAGQAYIWRVNSLTREGWVASSTGAFSLCAAPALLYSPLSCAVDFRGRADFRWAPSITNVRAQYLDLSLDPNFAPGSFTTNGPMQPTQDNYSWGNLPSDVRYYYRVNSLSTDGSWHPSQTGNFEADCTPFVSTELYGSADRLIVSRLGINAPVNVRDVGFDGALGDPSGATDVVRYSFGLFPAFQGYPGNGGTTMIAGHVDYYSYGLAVFAPLRNVQEGDVIEYYRGDGVKLTYRVDWFGDLPFVTDWNALATRTTSDSLVLITCNGTFDLETRNYDHRRVVHATIIDTDI